MHRKININNLKDEKTVEDIFIIQKIRSFYDYLVYIKRTKKRMRFCILLNNSFNYLIYLG